MIKYPRLLALLEALLVTLLWSSSYILIKIGLQGISPLEFAAVRYSIAFAVLLVASTAKNNRNSLAEISAKEWIRLIAAGISGYAVAQGLQFVGLYYLPAITTTFLLNFTPLFVVFFGALFLREVPTKVQIAGMSIALAGACLYFLTPILTGETLGMFVVLISGLGWAAYIIMVRGLQKVGKIGTFKLTTITMGCGAAILLISSLMLEGLPSISATGWSITIWLSLVNTAFAFYLWNRALRELKAYELSMLQNTMLIQISVLASIFLGERLTSNKVLGIIMVLVGIFLVHAQRNGNDN